MPGKIGEKISPPIFYSLMAVLGTYPLILHFTTHLMTNHNYPYTWNVWHFREMIEKGLTPLWTDLQYWPIGANLVTSTYTLGHGILGYFLAPVTGYVGALHFSVLLCAVLGPWGSYLLARYAGCSFLTALLVGFYVGFNAFSLVNIEGYHDYGGYWPLIFFIWAYLRALERPGVMRCFIAAIFLGCSFLYAQMYFSFCLVFAAACTVIPWTYFSGRGLPFSEGTLRRLRWAAGAALAAGIAWLAWDLVALGQIQWRGRGSFTQILRYVGPYWLTAAALASGLILWSRRWFTARLDSRLLNLAHWMPLVQTCFWYALLNAGLVTFALMAAFGGLDIDGPGRWRGGGTPTELLRFLIPNTDHPLLAPASSVFKQWPPEGSLQGDSLGWVVPIFLLVYLRKRPLSGARLWLVLGFISLILSLGPYLMVGGFHTYIPLPFMLLRILPLIGAPIQAVNFLGYVCHLFFGIVAALAFDQWLRERGVPRLKYALAAFFLLAFESMIPWPRRVYAAPEVPAEKIPPVYYRLRNRPFGAVLTVPFGLHLRYPGNPYYGDLGGNRIFYQMWHEHPLIGGFITRVPYTTFQAYAGDRFLVDLNHAAFPGASEGFYQGKPDPVLSKFLTDPVLVKHSLKVWDASYLVVEAARIPPNLAEVIRRRWPVRKIDEEGGIILYEFTGRGRD